MIDILINASRIKYTILDDIFSEYDIEEPGVNFFIDFHSIISRLYISDLDSHILNTNDDSVKTFAISVINTIGHYRRYFNKMKKESNIFVVFNKKIPQYQSDILSKHGMLYGTYYFDRYSDKTNNHNNAQINKLIEISIGLIKDILNYFSGIYFITGDTFEEYDMINYLIDTRKGYHNIVMTNNELNYQLIDNDNTIILLPSRDKSSMITKENLFDYILRDKKYRPEYVTYKMYLIYISLIGLRKRDIPSISSHSMVKTIKVLDMMLKESLITKNSSIELFLSLLEQVSDIDKKGINIIRSRYNAMSHVRSYSSFMQNGGDMIVESSIIDLYCDPRELDELNDKLGENYMIDIMNLIPFKKKKLIWEGSDLIEKPI